MLPLGGTLLFRSLFRRSQRDSKPTHINSVETGKTVDEFWLCPEKPITVCGDHQESGVPRWLQPSHLPEHYLALILLPGDRCQPDMVVSVGRQTRLSVTFSAGVPNLSADGLTLECGFWLPEERRMLPLATIPVLRDHVDRKWCQFEMDLGFLAGSEGVPVLGCGPGPSDDPRDDLLAVAEWVIGRTDRLGLLRARSAPELRKRNEQSHFSAVYRNSIYASAARSDDHIERPVRRLEVMDATKSETPSQHCDYLAPEESENAYDYAHRLLGQRIHQTPPDFGHRLRQRVADGPVRILSLACGAARIEADLGSEFGSQLHWTLFDLNDDLLRMASQRFPTSVSLDLIQGDLNRIGDLGTRFDVIMCVSALHHVVELEHVLRFIREALTDTGEFWSIGEYVGRNGSRLWPDAHESAQEVFSKLPPTIRRNRFSGVVDEVLPDTDCSAATFEGIRSEEIEALLLRWFRPVDVYKRNCFLWRLVNLAYAENYDLSKQCDRELVWSAVDAEYSFFSSGGRPTELHGVFQPLQT